MIETDKPKIIGVDRRHYPGQASVLGHSPCFGIDQSENPPPTLAVLVAGDYEDYACCRKRIKKIETEWEP